MGTTNHNKDIVTKQKAEHITNKGEVTIPNKIFLVKLLSLFKHFD